MKEMDVNKTHMKEPLNMDETSVIWQMLPNSHKFLLKKNLRCAIFVENYSSGAHTLFSMKKSTRKRKLMSVMNVEKPLAIAQTLFSIKEYILKRNPMNVVSVGKPSSTVHTSSSIR